MDTLHCIAVQHLYIYLSIIILEPFVVSTYLPNYSHLTLSLFTPPRPLRPPFQIQYEITRVRQKIKDLALLHDKHMNRPTLDDSSEEEHAIEITTQEITQVHFPSGRSDTADLL